MMMMMMMMMIHLWYNFYEDPNSISSFYVKLLIAKQDRKTPRKT